MKGHIRERSPGHWAIILDIIKDGTRKRKWHSFKGTKREAQAECARLVTTMKDGAYVEANKLTVGQYLLERLAQWETGKKVGPRTAERYRELINDQIIPHLGNKQLQKLKAIDIDNWHNTLIANGRKDGKGGLSNRTIGHAHRILSKGLKRGGAVRPDCEERGVHRESAQSRRRRSPDRRGRPAQGTACPARRPSALP